MKTCVILAGGKSSRMGRDKTLLPFGGFATLTHYGAHKFGRIFERVFVSSKFDKFNPSLPLIKDVNPEEFSRLNLTEASDKDGAEASFAQICSQDTANLSPDAFSPMLALYSILKNFPNESVFIVPADMPFVSGECARELYKFSGEYDMVIAADESHTHSLCGFFSGDLANAAGELFAAGEHKIALLRDRCRCKIVKFANADEFFNINYQADYKQALKEGNI
ncbi:molybdenum cofactor guanylyltransferase [uncultured Campylobacter sp.]|uniref:molybdenum cofactor guanylyltransferase n=1 Tax=uncultured Campylobacter sp. TaxID=218934 RepID=UPI00262B00E4|nr:molybdenum cofactor guanylyltransferase [uncultured Campylobacter sp.]